MVESNAELVTRIRGKRLRLERFLSAARPRRRRLINITIVGGSIAAALTAAPALGGQSFTAWLTGALGLTSPSWRRLCGGVGLLDRGDDRDPAAQVPQHRRARDARPGLQGEARSPGGWLTTGLLDTRQASGEYLKCVEDAAFLEAS